MSTKGDRGLHILWLKTDLLHPVDTGGRIRTYHTLRHLSRDHRITYLCLDDGPSDRDAIRRSSEYCDELERVPWSVPEKFSVKFYLQLARNLISPLPYFLQKFRSPSMREAIRRHLAEGDIDLLVCDFLFPSVNLPESVSVPTLLFQHNVEAQIRERHYRVQKNPVKRFYLWMQWRKALRYEARACRAFEHVVAVSEEDADSFREFGADRVSTVPTGVDTSYFRPSAERPRNPHGLVFTGSMDWLPNEDAIRYYLEQIQPLVREEIPDAELTVVGRNPPDSLVQLGQRRADVTVTGWVDDVRPYVEEAVVYVLPLRVGGGTRLKVFEAMAMEKPIVSTSIGVEGLPVRPDEELLVADVPEEFAASVVRLLRDQTLAAELAERAARRVRREFSWERVAGEFSRICRETVVARS